jgi:ADP-heptose:LPS heptosyltransferase
MRSIKVPAGIGDVIWILMKLINTGDKFRFFLPGGHPRRGKQIFDLLPQVTESCHYVDMLGYNQIRARNAATRWHEWRLIRRSEIYLSANEWLESGKRIERFLPDLATSYTLPYVTSDEDKSTAAELVPGPGYIGIYGSSYSTQRAWGFWDENGWYELIRLIPPGYTFVIIGADWDTDLATQLTGKLTTAGIPFVNTVGQPLGTVVEILKRLDYFIGFPSGLSILNETLGKRGLMFYPGHLRPMMYTWAHPDRLAYKDHIPLLFCTPQEAIKHIPL